MKTRQREGSAAEWRFALLCLLPALVLLAVFRVVPLYWGAGLSFTEADTLGNTT